MGKADAALPPYGSTMAISRTPDAAARTKRLAKRLLMLALGIALVCAIGGGIWTGISFADHEPRRSPLVGIPLGMVVGLYVSSPFVLIFLVLSGLLALNANAQGPASSTSHKVLAVIGALIVIFFAGQVIFSKLHRLLEPPDYDPKTSNPNNYPR